jgi:hypothetical protein
MSVHLMGVMGVHLMGVHLMGVHLMGVHEMPQGSHTRQSDF